MADPPGFLAAAGLSFRRLGVVHGTHPYVWIEFHRHKVYTLDRTPLLKECGKGSRPVVMHFQGPDPLAD